jgi:ABC-2 type transport system permease protein
VDRVFFIARREFISTVFTKGFLIGVVLPPLTLLVIIPAVKWLRSFEGPRLVGTVAVADLSGSVGDALRERFSPEEDRREMDQRRQQASRALGQSPLGKAAARIGAEKGVNLEREAGRVLEHVAGSRLILEILPAAADLEAEKARVRSASLRREAKDGENPVRIALIVIPPGTVRPEEGRYAPYQAFLAHNLDVEIQSRIQRRVADAIVDARLANDERLAMAGLTGRDVRALMERPAAEAVTLTPEGEKKAIGELAILVPMGFMLLLMMSVMSSGSQLMTTTVEEKSNRVMEVLLSAVSPLQLMTGKIVGQMCVGLLILGAYTGLGVGSLAFLLNRLDLISGASLAYLLLFFLIAYFLVASLMAAIGAAVNDMREAQTLLTPVMLVLMIPWLVWFVIQRAPNSTLAVVLSFVPGVNPFVMAIRLGGSEPVPTWQIPVAIGVGVVSVVVAAWGAAKVFRIGTLMYGKPPDLRTLWQWIRMA